MSLLGLVPDYGSDSSSSSDSDEDTNESEGSKGDSSVNTISQTPLPLPQLEFNKPSTSKTKEQNPRALQTSSVFFNPFLAEEKKKLSVLEQHVQLSESKPEEAKNKDKKKVCFKFQKGRCRLGDKCKFSHGGTTPDLGANSKTSEKPSEPPSLPPSFSNQETRYEPDEDEESWELKKKKRKPGVTDSLVPPKRSMAAYEKQQVNERPWSRS